MFEGFEQKRITCQRLGDANRRPQRRERVPPGSSKGGSGDGTPARAGLKSRLEFPRNSFSE